MSALKGCIHVIISLTSNPPTACNALMSMVSLMMFSMMDDVQQLTPATAADA